MTAEPLPITLTVRKVDIDFSQAKIDWCPNEPEYAQLLNGLSSGFPLLEPFLIKVVRQAKELAPEHMQKKLELFIAQEGRHYKQHAKWNHKLDEAGYELQPVLDKLAKSYEKALSTKSLQFNLGYCDGFETFGPILRLLCHVLGALEEIPAVLGQQLARLAPRLRSEQDGRRRARDGAEEEPPEVTRRVASAFFRHGLLLGRVADQWCRSLSR